MKSNKAYYDNEFYQAQQLKSYNSALVVLGHVFDVFCPKKIVDFGCGVGAWLKAAAEIHSKKGMDDCEYVGLDGDWGEKKNMIPDCVDFRGIDLENISPLDKKYDMAISVEVAEHLPESCARKFVSTICNSADVILFGAAIPGQGGVNHINEQYQSYWMSLFCEKGFKCIDLIRPAYFDDERIGVAYRQNLLLYVKEGSPGSVAFDGFNEVNKNLLDIVHPIVLDRVRDRCNDPVFLIRKTVRLLLSKVIK